MTCPVVPPKVPVPLVALVMLMMELLLDENDVELVTLLPFKVAAKVTVAPVPPAAAMLIGLAGLEVIVRVEDEPAVSVRVPVTTVPFDD